MTDHLRIPFEMAVGRARRVKAGSIDEIEQNVRVLVLTQLGQRLGTPDFGMTDPTFRFESEAVAEGELEAQVARFEPRARVEMIRSQTGADATIRVSVGA